MFRIIMRSLSADWWSKRSWRRTGDEFGQIGRRRRQPANSARAYGRSTTESGSRSYARRTCLTVGRRSPVRREPAVKRNCWRGRPRSAVPSWSSTVHSSFLTIRAGLFGRLGVRDVVVSRDKREGYRTSPRTPAIRGVEARRWPGWRGRGGLPPGRRSVPRVATRESIKEVATRESIKENATTRTPALDLISAERASHHDRYGNLDSFDAVGRTRAIRNREPGDEPLARTAALRENPTPCQ